MKYQPYYCEENMWHLAADPRFAARDAHVVWMSNRAGTCAVWQARAAGPHQPVLWDYHVVLAVRGNGGEIWDFDTLLGLPVPAAHYLRFSFLPVAPPYQARFRVVPASLYLEHFSSDRRHMRDGETWLQKPPAWDPIGPRGTFNLHAWRDMDAPFHGRVMELGELTAFLTAD